MTARASCVIALSAVAVAGGCAHRPPLARVVATVNGVPLTGYDLQAWRARPQPPGSATAEGEPADELQRRIDLELLAQEAESLGLTELIPVTTAGLDRAAQLRRQRFVAARGEAAVAELRHGAALEVDEPALDAVPLDGTADPDPVVATLDGLPITASEVKDAIGRFMRSGKIYHLVGNEKQRRVRRDGLDAVVDDRLIAGALAGVGAAEIDAASHLARADAAVTILHTRVLKDQIVVTDADVSAHLASHRESYRPAPRWQLYHIVTDSEAQATAALAELTRGADFGAVARAYSADTMSRGRDGLVGWLSADALPAALRQALVDQPLGAVSGPVAFGDQWIVAKRLAEEPGVLPADAALEPEAKRRLLAERLRRRQRDFLAELRAAARVELFPEELAAVAAALAPAREAAP